MRLRLRVGDIMRERGMAPPQLAHDAGIALNTARSLYHGGNERVDFSVLVRVGRALGVRPLDLIEEVEDAPGKLIPELRQAA